MELRLDDFEVSPEWADPEIRIPVVRWSSAKNSDRSAANERFWISPMGTWGKGIYLAACHTPLSAAHYGQVAVRGELQLGKVFDATLPDNIERVRRLFGRAWVTYPWPSPLEFSSDADNFKEMLVPQPDTIVFTPDEFNPHTDPKDIWFLVWSSELFSAGRESAIHTRCRARKLLLGIAERFDPARSSPAQYVVAGGSAIVDAERGTIEIGP
jgi:hypothetical protein